MNKQDFNQRISLVINSELENWQALNAASHISAYFGNLLAESFGTGKFFTTADGVDLPRNSQYPIVILKASPKQLKEFACELDTQGELDKMYFIKEMIDTTNDDKIEALVSIQDKEELINLGIGLFGDNKLIKKLTANFTLWS
ncbi:MAG: hypothetical protein S4CHLAM6_01810 [Chlamydiae bacterium]|nr:hypothetical protein [Chlamydiota bacterium]